MTGAWRRLLRPLGPPGRTRGTGPCEHLVAAPAPADQPDGRPCQACAEQGTDWVDLRQCLSCGYVGCCDSSPWKHAGEHFRSTGHPVMRSFVPGESWRWCFADSQLG